MKKEITPLYKSHYHAAVQTLWEAPSPQNPWEGKKYSPDQFLWEELRVLVFLSCFTAQTYGCEKYIS